MTTFRLGTPCQQTVSSVTRYSKVLMSSNFSWKDHGLHCELEQCVEAVLLARLSTSRQYRFGATLAARTNLVFNNMLFQGPSLTWRDCRYELLPYLHIPTTVLRPDRHYEFCHHRLSTHDRDSMSLMDFYPDDIVGQVGHRSKDCVLKAAIDCRLSWRCGLYFYCANMLSWPSLSILEAG